MFSKKWVVWDVGEPGAVPVALWEEKRRVSAVGQGQQGWDVALSVKLVKAQQRTIRIFIPW